jgi:hypothetical protein
MTEPSKIPEAVPHAFNPIDDIGAVDYREAPSTGGVTAAIDGAAPTYDQPNSPADQETQPWTDQTWAAYDEATDASRYRGINSPTDQAQLHLSPQGQEDAQGYSPSLAAALSWERAGPDGSPPPWQP